MSERMKYICIAFMVVASFISGMIMISYGMHQPFWNVMPNSLIWLTPLMLATSVAGMLIGGLFYWVSGTGVIRTVGAFTFVYALFTLLGFYLASVAYMWFSTQPISEANAFLPFWFVVYEAQLESLQLWLLLGSLGLTYTFPTIIIVACMIVESKKEKSSHFQSYSECRRNGLINESPTNLFIGKKRGQWLSDKTVALTAIAAARSGKTSSLIITNARKRIGIGSDIFNDSRGELHPILKSDYENAGYKVLVWSPYRPEQSASINPLIKIRYTPDDMVEDLDVIIDMIVPVGDSDNSTEDYFRTVSCDIIKALVLHRYNEVGLDKNKLTLEAIITMGTTENLSDLLDMILASADDYEPHMSTALKMYVRKIVESEDPKTKSNTILSAQVYLSKLYSPKILRTLSGNDIDIDKIRHQKTAIFIEIPNGKKEKMKKYLALFYQLLLSNVTEEGDFIEGEHQRITCYLDEFGNMAKIPALIDASTELGAFGLYFLFILQYMSQARKIYGDNMAEIIFGAGAKLIGSTNSLPDAQHFSDSCGVQRKKIKTGSGQQASYRVEETPVIRADEIRTMKKSQWLVLLEGQHPVILDKGFYFKDRKLKHGVKMQPNRVFKKV